jgi:endonuclease YncB( thermonuclease family)
MFSALLAIAVIGQNTDFGVRVPDEPPPATLSRSKKVRLQLGREEVGDSFTCSVIRVTDGDTLRCSDGTRVRLAGIDAPEISPCRSPRKCVPGDADASRRVLASLAADETLTCRHVGTSYSRTVAFCSS